MFDKKNMNQVLLQTSIPVKLVKTQRRQLLMKLCTSYEKPACISESYVLTSLYRTVGFFLQDLIFLLM